MSCSARGTSARYVGLDVGGTHVRVVTRVGDEAPGAAAVHALPVDYRAFLDAASIWIGKGATAVGIGLPGRVFDRKVEWVPNIPYLDDQNLADDLVARCDAPVTLANDAQCALLGELRTGAARHNTNVVLVSIGTGIGGAVAWSGRIVRGAHGTTGAFGWLPVACADRPAHAVPDPGAATGPSPGAPYPNAHGPWERLASGSALRRRIEAAALAKDALHHPQDARAAALLDAYLDDLAAGLAGIASAFDPHRIVLSGGVADLLEPHLATLRAKTRALASPVVHDLDLRVAERGSAAGAIGATYLATEAEGAFLP